MQLLSGPAIPNLKLLFRSITIKKSINFQELYSVLYLFFLF